MSKWDRTEPERAPVAVIGATGQQGSATVDALLERRIPVRALTRNVESPAARALAHRGVHVVAADLDDQPSVRRAFEGAAAAFAMTTIDGPAGPNGETVHGKTIGDAARAVQLPFLVYSSVGGAERHTGIPHFESKARVEEYLAGLVPLNIVRPTFFMENLTYMIVRNGDRATVGIPIPADVPLQMVSVRDIGRVAAALLAASDPDTAPIEIAGDELTAEQIANLVGQRLGVAVEAVPAPPQMFGDDEDMKIMFRWLSKLPAHRADFGRTRELDPDVEDLAGWLQRNESLG
ncbi:NmrA/HSCARG family protein [Rhodococcus sp. WMMA185]|uniref:NmrA/HSCARG family protein n=1 Tax=Rhodococcus sp. WMMA185 TaxID=679318 RepID=UPI000878C991|nr:NmrA/HSCARG family protein [Rhodococcus sp. WMMA185]